MLLSFRTSLHSVNELSSDYFQKVGDLRRYAKLIGVEKKYDVLTRTMKQRFADKQRLSRFEIQVKFLITGMFLCYIRKKILLKQISTRALSRISSPKGFDNENSAFQFIYFFKNYFKKLLPQVSYTIQSGYTNAFKRFNCAVKLLLV